MRERNDEGRETKTYLVKTCKRNCCTGNLSETSNCTTRQIIIGLTLQGTTDATVLSIGEIMVIDALEGSTGRDSLHE